jgi:hypothetical protein
VMVGTEPPPPPEVPTCQSGHLSSRHTSHLKILCCPQQSEDEFQKQIEKVELNTRSTEKTNKKTNEEPKTNE